MLCFKVWTLVLAVCLAEESCIKKNNLCQEVVLKYNVSCIEFTGTRLLLKCAGKEKEKVRFSFSKCDVRNKNNHLFII